MDEPVTWHHGLMTLWWAEVNQPRPEEVAFYRGAIERFGQPALDLACGVGRILLPLLQAGLDVDGVDVSIDMLDKARRRAEARGLSPSLTAQAMHDLDLPRRYRTVFICDSFGIGVARAETIRSVERIYEHLEPGGALVFSHDLPYASGETDWLRWLPGRHEGPDPWPEEGGRGQLANGDELELITRHASFDPLEQETVLEVRCRLWRDGDLLQEEEHRIVLGGYFVQEVVALLGSVGFVDVAVEAGYTRAPATSEDTTVVFVARRPNEP